MDIDEYAVNREREREICKYIRKEINKQKSIFIYICTCVYKKVIKIDKGG
jgi:hypothetical protein